MQLFRQKLARLIGMAAFAAALGGLLPGAYPALADGTMPQPAPSAELRCQFDTRAPAPGATIDRRFQEIVVGGLCNRPVKQVPRIFLDGVQKEVMSGGVTNPVQFAGLSSAAGLSPGTHRLRVVVTPRDTSIPPFVSTWTFVAR